LVRLAPLFRRTFGTNSPSETGIRWGQTRKCDAGGTRLCRKSDVRGTLDEDPARRVSVNLCGRSCPGRHQAEQRERVGQVSVRLHLRGVAPRADELADGRCRIETADVTVEQA